MKSIDDIRATCPNRGKEGKAKPRTQQRVLTVVEMIRKGYSRTRVIEELNELEGLRPKQATRIYYLALDYLKPTEEEANALRTEILAMTRNFIEECIEDGDRQSALKAMDQYNKLNGLYLDKIDMNVSGALNFGFTFDTGLENGGEEEGN